MFLAGDFNAWIVHMIIYFMNNITLALFQIWNQLCSSEAYQTKAGAC